MNAATEGTNAHVGITVEDMDRTLAFYCDLLGFKVEKDVAYSGEVSKLFGLPGSDVRLVWIRGFGLRVELIKFNSPEVKKVAPKEINETGITHFSIEVKNIQEWYERLVKAGVELTCSPVSPRPGVKSTYIKGPDGVTIQMQEFQ
jgi:catechol 2,3-dioxygenase-like lactoylglutathione lyase family enzyme